MTNEQLAEFIQQGGNDELIPLLWENVRKLVYLRAGQYFETHTEKCTRCGVELWDLKQAGYFAFLNAIKGFKADSGYMFTTFLNFPLKNKFAELTGGRIQSGGTDPLNNCLSLGQPVKEEDGENTTLGDLQADEQSTEFVERLDSALCSEIILNELSTLPDREEQVIRLYYLQGLTQLQIGEMLGLSGERVRQIKVRGERKLRQSSVLRKLYYEHYQGRYIPRWAYYNWQPQNFEQRYKYKY